MKFNFKSKLGFTLIELLVVIGILAVLAAIAIPSVAGLIDRANVSADATNANEMTNAVERFTTEYELYLQDIASGRLDTTNLDSAQGRVYNVTGITDRAGIEALEKDTTAGPDTTGKAIYRDTKYPVNAETMQAVVENYMKTSSTTFTPKQSDKHFWYSPEIGVVVVAKPNANVVTDLNIQVQSGNNAKGEKLDGTTIWIDITINITIDNMPNIPEQPDTPETPETPEIPETPAVPEVDMSKVSSVLANNSWETTQQVAKAGKASETGWKVGDTKEVIFYYGTDKQTTKKMTIIGIDHDGENTITFMHTYIQQTFAHPANSSGPSNMGGWENSDIRDWCNGELYEGLNIKQYIKPTTKMTNNIGYQGSTASPTTDFLFLLSPIEIGLGVENLVFFGEEYGYEETLKQEGKIYEYFKTKTVRGNQLLRSPISTNESDFFGYSSGDYMFVEANVTPISARVAFVIG